MGSYVGIMAAPQTLGFSAASRFKTAFLSVVIVALIDEWKRSVRPEHVALAIESTVRMKQLNWAAYLIQEAGQGGRIAYVVSG
jgi:hypothetical protein